MCGRFVVSYSYKELLALLKNDFDVIDIDIDEFDPNYNVAPKEQLCTIIHTKNGYKAGHISWGFQQGAHFFPNVRSETVERRFKKQISTNRCVFPASGYYEWDAQKIPHYLYQETHFYFAGLYQKKDNHFQASIITKKANDDIHYIHNRMPVILDSKQAKDYLQTNDILLVKELLNTNVHLMTHTVHKDVNKVSNNNSKNIEEYIENTLF